MTTVTQTKPAQKGNFRQKRINWSIAICESIGSDIHSWGNATTSSPAFIVYLGCRKNEVEGYVKTFNIFYRCAWCEVRKPKHLKEFEAEIKVRGMQRYSDSHAFGLDYLVESEQAKHFGADLDEYQYYTGLTHQYR